MMFVDFDIYHQMASLGKVYSLTLTYIFYFKCLKCEICSVSYVDGSKNFEQIQQYTFKHLRSNGVSTFYSSVTLTYIIEVKSLKYYFLANSKSKRKNVRETFVDFNICH